MSKTRCLKLKKKILEGKILSIDPTSGGLIRTTNETSQAGWAEFEKGKLTNSGVIEIPFHPAKEERFRSILEILQKEFKETYDVLIIEDIPMAPRRGQFNVSSTLIQACGVYIAGTSGELIEMATHTWQAIARRLGGWTKTDESDAIYIGLAAVAFAEGYHQKLKNISKSNYRNFRKNQIV